MERVRVPRNRIFFEIANLVPALNLFPADPISIVVIRRLHIISFIGETLLQSTLSKWRPEQVSGSYKAGGSPVRSLGTRRAEDIRLEMRQLLLQKELFSDCGTVLSVSRLCISGKKS